jgi:hypothetical protein
VNLRVDVPDTLPVRSMPIHRYSYASTFHVLLIGVWSLGACSGTESSAGNPLGNATGSDGLGGAGAQTGAAAKGATIGASGRGATAGVSAGGSVGLSGGPRAGIGGAGAVVGGAGAALPGDGVVPNPDLTRACAPASLDVISDFEENSGVMVKQGTPVRTGWWGVFSEKGTLTPAKSTTPIPVAASGDTAMCNKYALHVTGAGIGTYGGFNASFLPMAPSESRTAYDVSQYAGVRFKIKAGASTPPVIFVEMQTKQNQPTKYGGNLNEMNPGPDSAIGLFNGRGQIVTDVTNAWQTVHVPFGSLIPRCVKY